MTNDKAKGMRFAVRKAGPRSRGKRVRRDPRVGPVFLLAILGGAAACSDGASPATERVAATDAPLTKAGVTLGALTPISPGPSPFGDGSCSGLPSNLPPPSFGQEGEPDIAVDPRDPDHVVAIYQQDRFATGSSLADMTAVSRDGGRSFHLSRGGPPAFSGCTGGRRMQATDPRVAIGIDGTVYAVGTVVDRDSTNTPIADNLIFAVSHDGGESWGTPVEPYGAGLCEQSELVADRFRPGHAYWISRCLSPDFNTCYGLSLTTTDGAATWSSSIVDTASCDDAFLANQDGFAELGDGTLTRVVRVVNFGGPPTAPDRLYSSRSRDLGRTWSPPKHLADSFTPGTTPLRIGFPVVAADPRPLRREVYAVWPDADANNISLGTRMAVSRNGGESWDLTTISSTASVGACLAAVAVNDDGVVGVSYMDGRFATDAQPGLADGWIVTVGAGAVGPRVERRLTNQSFDASALPVFFTGDYHAIAAGGDSFHPIIVLGTGQPTVDPTDVFSRRVTVQDGAL
ncbi:MAG TPA: sialidase family protein [Polyangiaceae bacterium]|jgi:hypothetical protein